MRRAKVVTIGHHSRQSYFSHESLYPRCRARVAWIRQRLLISRYPHFSHARFTSFPFSVSNISYTRQQRPSHRSHIVSREDMIKKGEKIGTMGIGDNNKSLKIKRDLYLREFVVFFECLDTILERWVCRPEWVWLTDHKRRHLFVEWFCVDEFADGLEFLESRNHTFLTRELCTSEIGSILTNTREVHNHYHGKHPENNLEEYIDSLIGKVGDGIIISLGKSGSHKTCGNMREKYHKSIHHSLKQSKRHHISIEYMSHLMANHSFDFRFFHGIEESCWNCHESTIFGCPCRESVGIGWLVVSHLWHHDMIGLSYAFNRIPDELELGILRSGSSIENLYTVGRLCHPPRNPKRDKWSKKPKYCCVYEEISHSSSKLLKSRKKVSNHCKNNPKKNKDSNIDKNEEKYTFNDLHMIISYMMSICPLTKERTRWLYVFICFLQCFPIDIFYLFFSCKIITIPIIHTCITFLTFYIYVRKQEASQARDISRSQDAWFGYCGDKGANRYPKRCSRYARN